MKYQNNISIGNRYFKSTNELLYIIFLVLSFWDPVDVLHLHIAFQTGHIAGAQ